MAVAPYALYAVSFGVILERLRPGGGLAAGLSVLVISAGALAAGLVARMLLRARDRRRLRVEEMQRQRATARQQELSRLADELQRLVIDGLSALRRGIEAARTPAGGLQSLEAIDSTSRTLQNELRTLLAVLRGTEPPMILANPQPPRLGRGFRICAAGLLAVLAAAALVMGVPGLTAGDRYAVVPALCLLAAALVLVNHTAASLAATAALLLGASAPNPYAVWEAVSSAVISFTVVYRPSRFRQAIALLAFAGTWLALVQPYGEGYVIFACYGAGIGASVALAGRHFEESRVHAQRQLEQLAAECAQICRHERGAVARELHDVVGHQLSVINLLIMAGSAGRNPAVLATTIDQIDAATDAAENELSTLLDSMRDPDAEPTPASPLITATRAASSLAARLEQNDFTAGAHRGHWTVEVTLSHRQPAASQIDPAPRQPRQIDLDDPSTLAITPR